MGERAYGSWRAGGSAELFIEAVPAAVYARVSDVTGTGARSLECRRCEWLPGARPGAPGSRFRGSNRTGLARWARTCEVTRAVPGEVFEFRTLPERFDVTRRDSTTWGYEIQADGAGSLVRHYYEITQPPSRPLRAIFGWALPHHKDMRPHLEHTLRSLQGELVPDAV